MGDQQVAYPYGWRNDKWLHNVQELIDGSIFWPIGQSPGAKLEGKEELRT